MWLPPYLSERLSQRSWSLAWRSSFATRAPEARARTKNSAHTEPIVPQRMAAEQLTPTEYINHHLTFMAKPLGDGGFWTLHVDSLAVSVLTGIIGIGLFWLVARGATSGVPNKRQAFVELAFDFIDEQVKGIFHGDRHKFVAPAAFTVFFWVLLMNAMDFLPAD